MLTYENLTAIIFLLEALLTEISALRGALQNAGGALTQASAEAIAAFAIRAHEKLDAIDAYVSRDRSAPHTIPRDRAIATATPAHSQLIEQYLANIERYLSEALELANELLQETRIIDRESRASLEALSNCSRMPLLGVEIQLYRLPGCQGRIIFDSRFRLDGECGIDRCFCNK